MCGLSSHGEEQVASVLVKETQGRGGGGAGESATRPVEMQSEWQAYRWHQETESCAWKGHIRAMVFMPGWHPSPSTCPHFAVPSAAAWWRRGGYIFSMLQSNPESSKVSCPTNLDPAPIVSRGTVMRWGPRNCHWPLRMRTVVQVVLGALQPQPWGAPSYEWKEVARVSIKGCCKHHSI